MVTYPIGTISEQLACRRNIIGSQRCIRPFVRTPGRVEANRRQGQSARPTSQPRRARLLELRIHQEGSKRLRRLDALRWREGEKINDIGLRLFGEIRQVRFDDRVSFLGRHTLRIVYRSHGRESMPSCSGTRRPSRTPRCQNFFDLAGFVGPSGFPWTRGGMRHGSCLSTQSYMSFAVFRKAVVSPVSRRPVSSRSVDPLSNRIAAFAWPGRAEGTRRGFATHRAAFPVDAFLPQPLSP